MYIVNRTNRKVPFTMYYKLNKFTKNPVSMPKIFHLSRLYISPRYSERFHADVNNELCHVIDGSMVLRLESGEEYSAKKNETLFIPRGIRHRDIFNMTKGLEIFTIKFKWKTADKFFDHAAPDCLKSARITDKHQILLLFDMLRLDEYEHPEDIYVAEARLAHLLSIAWRTVFSEQKKQASVQEADKTVFAKIINNAQGYMHSHLSENIDIEHVAAQMKVSRSTLVRAFRHSSELSFNEYLRSIRMQEAYRLLREKTYNLSDCAAQCGFSDPAYFSKTFKKYFGFSPKDCK